MQFINSVLNVIYPNVCGICNKICKDDICPKCFVKLNERKICKKHIFLTKSYTNYFYIFKYDDFIRKTIIQYKFGNQAYRYKCFSKFIIKDKKICGFLKNYDIIIPVPIGKIRKQIRGYNQSELIAKELAKQIKNIKLETNILYKIKNTLPQSSLNKEQRKSNLKDAYIVKNSEKIQNKKILLFDDIYTTGNTVQCCGEILKSNGAYEIRSFNTCKRLKRKELIYGRFSRKYIRLCKK